MRHLPALAVLLALTLPAAAEGCVPTTTDARVCVVLTACAPGAAAGFYVMTDCPVIQLTPCGFGSAWIYQESNGIDGLQRRDEIVDNTCGGAISGDTIIF